MALGDVVMTLEDLTQMRIPPGMIKPKDMDKVAKARVGKARK
ncbi:MAG: hypothetical protein ACLQLC_18215 [Candidatus Sulfotelmatobacter sp.]